MYKTVLAVLVLLAPLVAYLGFASLSSQDSQLAVPSQNTDKKIIEIENNKEPKKNNLIERQPQ